MRYCRIKGKLCAFATEYGYCSFTVCREENGMSLREEQCNKVCRILDNVLANRPTERDSLIVATRNAFSEPHWIPVTEATPTEDDEYLCTFDAETGRFVDWCNWYQGKWTEWTDDTVSEVRNVIAWRKPIEPYKEVTE